MPSVSLWASSAEILFLICEKEKPAGFSFSLFHGKGRNGKQHLLALAPLRGAAAAAAEGPINRRNVKKVQRRRPPPAADTGRSCWGSGLQDASAAQGTKQTQGAATRLSEAAGIFSFRPLPWDYQGRAAPCLQRRRPPPAADTGRSCWGSGLQDASAAQGTKWTLGTATRPAPARRNRRALAALNTRHLLRKPVCGLKAPLGLSCPPGTAVLSGSLLSVKREYLRPATHHPKCTLIANQKCRLFAFQREKPAFLFFARKLCKKP